MAESNRKLSAPLQKFAVDLRETLIRTENSIRELRAREASTRERKLEKHELCPLCGGPDINGRCKCVVSLQKNAQLGYGSGSSVGPAGGGGTQPMGMSEGVKKNELCKSCGKAHDGDHDYDHDGDYDDKPKMAKHMPSSSAGALAPKAPAPMTPVHQANQELGSATSIASSPIHSASMGGSKMMTPKKFNVHAAGRVGNPVHSVSGEIANAKAEMSTKYAAKVGITGKGNKAKAAYGDGPSDQEPAMHQADMPHMQGDRAKVPYVKKAEKNPGSARSPFGTGAAGNATQANMPSMLQANMASVKKDELPVVKPAPEKSVAGAKAPKAGKKVDAKKQGSGGEIKGNPLSKAAPALAAKAPEGKGVTGKQPVGQGGGDAHKVAATAQLPGPGGATGASPWRMAPVKSVPKPAALGNGAAPAPGTGTGPAAAMSARLRSPAAQSRATVAAPQGSPLQAMSDAAKLGDDKKAGGVGFLRGLMSMFHSPSAPVPGAPQQQGQASSQRFHGALPLRRAEAPATDKKPEAPKPQQQQGQSSSKRFHGALPLRRGEMDMRKAALSLTKKDLDNDELDKGLGSINHNRRMLSIVPKSRSKKKR